MKYELLIAEYASMPWAMLPERLHKMAHVMRQRARGESVRLEHNPSPREQPAAEDRPAVALVNLHGSIFNRSMLAAESGLTTVQEFERSIRAAANAKNIEEIIVSVDSPGGVALNIDEGAAAVRYAGSLKPVTAIANGYMASAAYWIGSQATRLVATPLSAVGSIGVITSHSDYSRFLENEGVDLKIYRTGSRKALGQPTDPNDDDYEAIQMAELMDILGVFAADVATGRGMTVDDVLERFALDSEHPDALRGGTVLGAEAVRLGLADELGTLNGVLSDAVARTAPKRRRYATKGARMNEELLKALDVGEVTPEMITTAIDEAKKEGRALERASVCTLLGVGATATDHDLAQLKAQAADGVAYRENLLSQLGQAVIRAEGNTTEGQKAAERAQRLYASAEISDLEDEVKRLETKVIQGVPQGRLSTDETTDDTTRERRVPASHYGG